MNTYEKLHNALKGLFDNGLIPLPRNSAACPPCIFDGGYSPTNEICQICKSETKKRCIALYNAYAALLESPRNCDMGTAEEQIRRIRSHCKQHRVGLRCIDCSVKGVFPKDCALIWAQMPYAAHKEEGNKQ